MKIKKTIMLEMEDQDLKGFYYKLQDGGEIPLYGSKVTISTTDTVDIVYIEVEGGIRREERVNGIDFLITAISNKCEEMKFLRTMINERYRELASFLHHAKRGSKSYILKQSQEEGNED